MIPEKYAAIGFEVTKFGANSKVIRYHSRPVFVFDSQAVPDTALVESICSIYLKLTEIRKNLSCIKV